MTQEEIVKKIKNRNWDNRVQRPGFYQSKQIVVEAKVAAEQDAQRMEFVLKKESQEAERKRLEAKGIADAQAIIKKDLDPHYLTYLWIEALKEGAKHNNAVIYIPTGTDGMPMFKKKKRRESKMLDYDSILRRANKLYKKEKGDVLASIVSNQLKSVLKVLVDDLNSLLESERYDWSRTKAV
jgi:hypothetical protein